MDGAASRPPSAPQKFTLVNSNGKTLSRLSHRRDLGHIGAFAHPRPRPGSTEAAPLFHFPFPTVIFHRGFNQSLPDVCERERPHQKPRCYQRISFLEVLTSTDGRRRGEKQKEKEKLVFERVVVAWLRRGPARPGVGWWWWVGGSMQSQRLDWRQMRLVGAAEDH